MADRGAQSKVNLKLPKTFKEVSSLTKPRLKEICKVLFIDFEKSIGKKALVNIVCNGLKISTSGPSKHCYQAIFNFVHQHSNSYVPSKTKRLAEKLKWSTATDGRIDSKRVFDWS